MDRLATFEMSLLFRKHILKYIQGPDITEDLSRNLLNIDRVVGGYKKPGNFYFICEYKRFLSQCDVSHPIVKASHDESRNSNTVR